MSNEIMAATKFIMQKWDRACNLGIILGSGLGDIVQMLEDPIFIPYSEIPHFPISSVVGHAGSLALGTFQNSNVALMQGRVHYYEGFNADQVVFPVRVLRRLGVNTLIVTNAAGGINPDFASGNLMVIRDHINFMGFNPLRGKNNPDFGPRFPDMTFAYTPELRKLAFEVGAGLGIDLREGVYLGVSGPSYETPAEIRMCRGWGADAVGMSTVPEVIAASHMEMKVLGISCITNMAAGILNQPLTHEEVLETTARVRDEFIQLLSAVVGRLKP